ncbi:hypothetical protein KC19_10G086200 [Ceratodon purpureus]|uniref:Uncharacterized protein n=1 Tax=Ceratodon purpureus TaxID=3225 RepID=A0A8T0GLZ1_CERPU|nr:hypothetical protein KC19_10G086200 [Ceratodon purpureus]
MLVVDLCDSISGHERCLANLNSVGTDSIAGQPHRIMFKAHGNFDWMAERL